MKELSSSIVRLIQFVEYYLCPQYCGVVDRRRVIAYLFTTLIELIVIPFHFFLFLMVWEPSGFTMVCLHLVAFILIQYMIWKQVLRFHQGVSALFLLVAVKLVADSVLCTYFGALDDDVTVIGNIFVMLILDIAALSLMLQKNFLGDYPDGDTADSFLLSYPSAWRVVLYDETYSGGCLDAGVCLYL